MSDYREYINAIDGVSSGNAATAKLVVGRRYLRLKIYASAETDVASPVAVHGADVIDGILLTSTTPRGNVQLLDLDAVDFVKDAKFNGLNPAANEIPIHFAEPKRATVIEEVATAFDTYDLIAATLKMKIKSGLKNINLKVLAIYDYGFVRNEAGARVINFIKKTKLNQGVGAGVSPVTIIPTDYPLLRLLFDGPSNVTDVQIIADSMPRHEATVDENNDILHDYGFATGEYKYELVFDETQRLTGALSVNKDLVCRVTSAAEQQLSVIIHQLVPAYV